MPILVERVNYVAISCNMPLKRREKKIPEVLEGLFLAFATRRFAFPSSELLLPLSASLELPELLK